MADGELTLQIDAALAERLRARAEAAGQSVEAYALHLLGEGEAAVRTGGFGEDSEAYADEIDRICDEAERTGGIPFEVFQARLRNLGQRR